MRRELEYQADQIEMVLHSHKVPGRVLGGVVTPRWVRFEVVPALGAKVSSMARLSEEIALRLGRGGVRGRRQGSTVRVEVPREDGEMVRLLRLASRLGEIPRQAAVLGLDEEGVPLLLRLPSPEVGHVLVSGTTGSGKTALARSMVLSLALHNRQGEVQLVVIDPKGRGYEALGGLPHLKYPVLREVSEAAYALSEMVGLMIERDREGLREPRVVVVIDEMADLVMAGGAGVSRSIMRLTQRGREAGLHVIGCTQKPTVDAIGSLVKSNFPVRLVGSVVSAEDAKVASGLPGTGAEKLMGRGDFLLVVKGEVTRFQAAYVSQGEIEHVVGQLRQGERKSRRPEWLVAGETGPSAGLRTGSSTNGTGRSTGNGAGWRERELEKTGTEGERGLTRKRPVMARVAEQLRLIK
jgi:S-DNA-T family DNA segregation ATPase FtsK/SpoIIIE